MKKEVRIILHNIRSAHNVGAILRTADGAGAGLVYCTGYTPTPVDRFGKVNVEIAKTALGAEVVLRWEKKRSFGSLVRTLKKKGFAVVAVEQGADAIPLKKHKQSARVAYVFGNEVDGLTKGEIAHCDAIVEIPMKGSKESLNVSAAAAIVLYRSLV